MRLRHKLAVVVAVVAGLLLAASGAARAAPIAPGFDLFETNPMTQFVFSGPTTIPANFFGPNSAPFTGMVRFGGDPLMKFQGVDTGDTDTIVQRMGSIDPVAGPGTVPVQMMALNLISVEPIMVTGGGSWDVHVTLSKSAPSMGQITNLRQTGPDGGLFNSSLQVLPNFTFTGVSKGVRGQKRTLDIGALAHAGVLPKAVLDDLTLYATDTPWRRGCQPPALAAKGLNDGFCPSETPSDQKQLTFEESMAAAHGFLAAQPRLEHFKCYGAIPRGRFSQRTVALRDQFGSESATVVRPLELCNPVRKNAERLMNTAAHLKCYGIRTQPFSPRTVPVRNQFGSGRLVVVKPVTLCEPAEKQKLPAKGMPKPLTPDQMIDNFKCYAVRALAPFKGPIVSLRDQFHAERTRVLQPVQLCAPTSKNGGPILHPVRHLVCYRIRGLPVGRVVRVQDQFGSEILRAGAPTQLCVPSIKGEQAGPPPFVPPGTPPNVPPGTPTLTSITVMPVNQTITRGSTQAFTATGNYSDGSTKALTTTVTWGSSNMSVATISNAAGSQGVATAVNGGTTTISATSGSTTGSTTLTVTCPHANGLGQNYNDCADPLGTPGNPTTYSQNMALAAAQAWPFAMNTMLYTCSAPNDSVIAGDASHVAVWVFRGTAAGYVHAQNNTTPVCPTNSDPPWT